MNSLLLDTGILMDALSGRRERLDQLARLSAAGYVFACTSINVTEVYMGMRAHEAERTERFLRSLEFYPITWEVAELAGRTFWEWWRKGVTLSLADVSVAAVCVVNRLVLVTEGAGYFPMEGLQVRTLRE